MGESSRGLKSGRAPLCVDLLGGGESMYANLSAALADVGGRLRRFERAEQWVEAVREEVPDATVVPAALSTAIAEMLGKLSLSGIPAGNVLLATFGRPKERLDALIGGADWFVERSTDPLLGQALVDWLLQQDVEPFRVLLIDDDRETRMLCSAILRKVGMVVEELAETTGVLAVVKRFRPDLVLLDLHMPDQDGIAVVQALRSSDIAPLLPIVFLSGEDRPNARNAALRAGGDDFLAKPVRPQALIAAVRSRVKRARVLNRQLRPRSESASGRLRRSDFLSALSECLQRTDDAWHLLLALRIDDAPALREKLGLAGTHALEREVANRIASQLAPEDSYSLWEELGFGLMVSRNQRAELESLVADLLTAVAGAPFVAGEESLSLSISIGFSLPPTQGVISAERWVQQAFAALAMARRLGTGRAEGVLSRDPSALAPERIMVITQALKDLARGSRPRFEFQPMLQLRGEQAHFSLICKLADLRNPLEGYPRPQYLELAREQEQLSILDRMALFHAIETLDDRRRQGLAANIMVPVDLGAFDERQLAWLKAERQRRPDAVGDLLLEVDVEDIRSGQHVETLRHLTALGMNVAGYDHSGSVMALHDLLGAPISLLSLPHGAIQTAGAQLSDLITEWRGSGRRLLVVGVESMKSVSSLWNLGIDYLQGDALAAAIPRIDDGDDD
ncbi:response regulator [Pseudomarimonas arenosa]|uniref:Response regulator n=1 Tax=Pseudomarimonas arenosa TaxID=2774145 RepID=A0AAW3ZJK9_9GAMM|nr:response regulator [Pseudomarimonas arenosa]MBD8526293.1 response regulator [Pseudomarimonas arenosa]